MSSGKFSTISISSLQRIHKVHSEGISPNWLPTERNNRVFPRSIPSIPRRNYGTVGPHTPAHAAALSTHC